MYLALELRYEVETALASASEADRNELRVLVRLDDWRENGGAGYPEATIKVVLDALHRSYEAELEEALPTGATEELRQRVRDRVG